MRTLFILLVFLVNGFASHAQSCQLISSSCGTYSYTAIGVGNTTNSSTSYPRPFGNWYTRMRAQYIYKVAELQLAGMSAGNIGALSFNVTSIQGAPVYPEYHVRIGCTSQTTFSPMPAPTDLLSGLTEVFYAPTYSVVLGDNTFAFTQPYQWDGISNIVVEVCFEFPGQSNYTLNSVVICTNTQPDYQSLNVVTDTDTLCAGFDSTGMYSPHSSISRPDVKFGQCVGTTNNADVSGGKFFRTYPVPACDYLNVEVATGSEISVFNMAGRLLLTEKVESKSKLDVRALVPGIYFLKLETQKGEVVYQKFAVSR